MTCWLYAVKFASKSGSIPTSRTTSMARTQIFGLPHYVIYNTIQYKEVGSSQPPSPISSNPTCSKSYIALLSRIHSIRCRFYSSKAYNSPPDSLYIMTQFDTYQMSKRVARLPGQGTQMRYCTRYIFLGYNRYNLRVQDSKATQIPTARMQDKEKKIQLCEAICSIHLMTIDTPGLNRPKKNSKKPTSLVRTTCRHRRRKRKRR